MPPVLASPPQGLLPHAPLLAPLVRLDVRLWQEHALCCPKRQYHHLDFSPGHILDRRAQDTTAAGRAGCCCPCCCQLLTWHSLACKSAWSFNVRHICNLAVGRLCCHSMHLVHLESRYTLCQVRGMLIVTTPHKTGGQCLRSHLVSRPDEKARRCSCTDDAARKLRLRPEHAACEGSRWAAPLYTSGRLLHADCPQCILR